MITNTGKAIIAKYMLGQITDYASYIAVGCGPKPITAPSGTFDIDAYALKENLDFEMFRVPIISRGLITEVVNGENVTKVVLTAELPTENRYEMSEIGVFSAGENTVNASAQSRSIYTFSDGESWTYNSATPPLVVSTADDTNGNVDQNKVGSGAFYLNSDNPIFESGNRSIRYERPRNMNSSLYLPGNSSKMIKSGQDLTELTLDDVVSNIPLRLNAASLNLDKYSTEDELRLAFSVLNKAASPTTLGSVRVKVEFKYSVDGSESASFDSIAETDLDTNRYFVTSKKLKDFVPNGFSWESVRIVNIYVSAHAKTGTTIDTDSSGEFYVALDGLRIENNQSNNPAYGMIGYSVLKTVLAKTVLKKINSSSYVEFRFALGVN